LIWRPLTNKKVQRRFCLEAPLMFLLQQKGKDSALMALSGRLSAGGDPSSFVEKEGKCPRLAALIFFSFY
jgi:hypothetical protein